MVGKDKSDSLVKTILATGRIGLMCIGIVGIAVEFFRDDGILRQFLEKIFSSTAALWWIPIIIIIAYLLNRWLSTSDGKASKKGDLPLYIMMAVGAFFLFRLITTGSF